MALSIAGEIDPQRLVAHRQVSDAHLLVLARRHGGRVVTFDGGLVDLVPGAEVELLRF